MTKSVRGLPKGWRWVRLADVAGIQNGYAFPSENFGNVGTPLIRIRDLRTNQPSLVYSGSFDPVYLMPQGALLIGMDGEFRCYRWSGPKALLNQRICHLLPKATEVNRDFLFYAMDEHLRRIESETAFTTVKHISSGDILNIVLALPPLLEQHHIAALLGEQMTAVARVRAAAEVQVHTARVLWATRLRQDFRGEEARSWPVVPLRQYGEIVSGITLGRKLKRTSARLVPYLRVANVKDGRLDLTEVYEIEASDAEIDKLRLRNGDILLTEGGDPDKLGRGTYWADELPECVHQNHIYRVRFDLEQFSPEFIAAQIGSAYGKAYFLAHAKQTTGIATINQKVLGAFPLMVPALAIQRQIASQLESLRVEIERLRTAAEAQLAGISKLPRVLLSRALNGALL